MVDNNLKIFDMAKEIKSLDKKKPSEAIDKIVHIFRAKKNLHTSNFLMHGVSNVTYGIREGQKKSNYKQLTVKEHLEQGGS